jgi:predicted HTH transcriptional regulator
MGIDMTAITGVFFFAFNLIAATMGTPKWGQIKKLMTDMTGQTDRRKDKLAKLIVALDDRKVAFNAGNLDGKKIVFGVYAASSFITGIPGQTAIFENSKRQVINRASSVMCIMSIKDNAAILSGMPASGVAVLTGNKILIEVDESEVNTSGYSVLWDLYKLQNTSDLSGVPAAVQENLNLWNLNGDGAPDEDSVNLYNLMQDIVFSAATRGARTRKWKLERKPGNPIGPSDFLDLKKIEEAAAADGGFTNAGLLAYGKKINWTFKRE